MKKTILALLFIVVTFIVSQPASAGWSLQTSGTTYDLKSISFATKDIGLACAYSGLTAILKRTTDGGIT